MVGAGPIADGRAGDRQEVTRKPGCVLRGEPWRERIVPQPGDLVEALAPCAQKHTSANASTSMAAPSAQTKTARTGSTNSRYCSWAEFYGEPGHGYAQSFRPQLRRTPHDTHIAEPPDRNVLAVNLPPVLPAPSLRFEWTSPTTIERMRDGVATLDAE